MTGRRKIAARATSRGGDATARGTGWLGTATAALLLWAPASLAVDPPHNATTPNGFCMDCHTPHNAQGPALQAQPVACLSCHNALPKPPTIVSGFGLSQGWAAADQAGQQAGVGSSHSWSKSAVNAAAAAQLPTDPAMLARINNPPVPYRGNLSCAVCHDPHSQANLPFDPASPTGANAAGRHFMRYPNASASNGLCVQCHAANDVTAADTYTGAAESHPVRRPLPSADTTFYTVPQLVGGGAQVPLVDGAATAATTTSLTDSTKSWGAGSLVGQWVYLARLGQVRQITANTATQVSWATVVAGLKVGDIYQVDKDGNPSNKHALLNGSSADGTIGNVVCLTCHAVHYADSDSTTIDNKPGGGDGRLLRRSLTPSGWVNSAVAGKDDACVGCHNLRPHSSTVTATGRYTFAFGCTDCHDAHGTANVMLVKQTLTYKAGFSTTGVDLRALNTAVASAPDLTFGPAKNTGGVGPNDLANSLASGKGPCEACHTQTQDLAAAGAQPRFRNTGGGANGRHFQNQCLACHPHNQGFKGQESAGNLACYPCHSYGMRNADAAALKQDTYHHVIESDAVAGFTPSATPTTAIDGDKRCIQCHDDHPFGASRAANLNTAVNNATPVATDYATATPYGVCLSCHTSAQTKNTTDQKTDGTTATYAIVAADYAASPHSYASEPQGTIFKATSGSFTVSCVKCHSDGQPTATQSGTFKFALHSSPDRRLRSPLGITTFAAGGDALEESFCYRCHSATTDATPGGGPAKGTAQRDYFNAAPMSAAAEDIFAQMQKGTAGTPGGQATTSTNTLYFKPSAQEAAPLTLTGHFGNDTFNSGTFVTRSMSPYMPTGADEQQDAMPVNVPTGTTVYYRRVAFVSPQVAQAVTTSAAAWTINVYDDTTSTGSNPHVRYAIYKYDGTCTYVGASPTCPLIVARANYGSGTTNRFPTTPGLQSIATAAGNAVALNVGDRIVVDLEINTQATTAQTNQTMAYFFGATSPSNVVMPNAVTFTYASQPTPSSGRHDVGLYSGLHRPNPTEETRAYIAANRHVECEDCHNPHAASAGLHRGGATYTTTASSTLYLRNNATTNAVPPADPTAYQYSSGTYTTDAFNQRDMAPTSGATTASTNISTGNIAARYDRGLQFVSPQIDNTVTIPSGSSFNLTLRESRATGTTTDYTRFTVYKWNGTTATPFNTSAAPNNFAQNATAISTTATNRSTTFTSNQAVTLNPGDALVVDVEFYHSAGTTALNVTYTYGNFGTDAAALALPAGTYNWRTASGGLPAVVFAPVLKGASGVDVTTWGTNWAGVTTWNPSATTAPLVAAAAEWQVCFKCHSSANANVATWGGSGAAAFTDLSLEFNPNNEAYHPVIQALPATGNRQLDPGALTGGWAPGMVMACSDCHGTDSAASHGPHGSGVKWMLNPTTSSTKYYNWPYAAASANGTSSGTLVNGTGSTTVPTANFCFSCHVWSLGGPAHTQQGGGHSVACVSCHIRVPHGGKVLRLLTGPNAPARYKPDGNGGGTVNMNGGTRPSTGQMQEANCNNAASPGCNQHTTTGSMTW